jgi:L-histidine N-alpha-methyltransferase
MSGAAVALLRADVAAGLSRPQKEVPSKYFYDTRGSRLFESITALPEYYLTRTERALLEGAAPELVGALRPRSLSELGAGAARKTRLILDAMRGAGCAEVYQPIDVSAAFLARTAARLREEYPGLRVEPVVADFNDYHPDGGGLPAPRLYVFLGSTIGNLEPLAAVRLLARIRAALEPTDRLLLGVDLKKDPARLEAAYNDAAGVTAEFNRNLLRFLNRELGADFDLAAFEHRADYRADAGRIEMHLVSTMRQRVMIPEVGTFDFHPGESIRTEISCKYDRAQVDRLCGAASLAVEHWWTDAESLFALILAAPV